MKLKFTLVTLLSVLVLAVSLSPSAATDARFEISFPADVDSGPITGRVFVVIARSGNPEPRLQAGSYVSSVPFFGKDVSALRPGDSAVIDTSTLGFPLEKLSSLPAGDYVVQAVLNVYTEVHRKDGHTLWVHLDQWEGQQWNRSPGNLVSDVQLVHLDPAAGFDVRISFTRKLPAIAVPPDTEWIKRVRIQSTRLTEFWGHPIYLGAALLLPKGYDQNPQDKYPAIYVQGHFGLGSPLPFATQPGNPETPAQREARLSFSSRGTAYEFYQSWISDDFPRMVAVSFQHPTPYYDDSYAVNSVNNGPYGDALIHELIPYLEEHFRIIPAPYARVLTGGSTGGWEALALQIFHPDFFNGVWSLCPDPVDFRRNQLVDVYDDDNAFTTPGPEWERRERPVSRDPDGQVTLTMREMSQLDEVLGSRARSGQQFAAWWAAYGPVGDDGYPKPLWDNRSGAIDKTVAAYMRGNGFDLRDYVERNWLLIGPDLSGKIHVYVGDMDNYYLNLAVYLFESSLNRLASPAANAVFEYGRPMKPHGWQPMSNTELVRMMYRHVSESRP